MIDSFSVSDVAGESRAGDYAVPATVEQREFPHIESNRSPAPGLRAHPELIIAPAIERAQRCIHHLRCPRGAGPRARAFPAPPPPPQQLIHHALYERLLNMRWIAQLDHLHLISARQAN